MRHSKLMLEASLWKKPQMDEKQVVGRREFPGNPLLADSPELRSIQQFPLKLGGHS